MNSQLYYNILSTEDLHFFMDKTEELLETRGMTIRHKELKKALAECGCIVERSQVRFPKELIHKAVASVPSHFTLASPSGEHDLNFPNPTGSFYTRTCTGAPNYQPADGSSSHYATLNEVKEWYHLANQLPNIDFVTLPSTSGEEVPPDAVDIYTLEYALRYSKKHIWIQPYGEKNVRHLINMCYEASGSKADFLARPICSFIACSVPVLSLKKMDAEILYQCAMEGIPVQPCSLPTAGANAPVTAQGVSLVACAEVLAMIVILELLHPGLPVIATPLLFSMDMKTTYTLQSSPEITNGRMLCMQVFEQGYHIPAHSYGTGTDSLSIDEQNLSERTALMQMMSLSGASVLGGAGQLETAKTISPLQLIIDDELFGISRHLRGGLEINEETLDLEELLSGEDKSGYLMSMHTYRHYKDIYRPDLFNRDGFQDHIEGGTIPFMKKVHDKYADLTKNPVAELLSEEQAKQLHKIVETASANLLNKGE